MSDGNVPADRFEEHRPQLRAVAYRMLGSRADADDAVQEAWLRLARTDSDEIDNIGGWLTTVVGRVCLDMLRSRKIRNEEPLGIDHLPEPVVADQTAVDPESEVLLADSIGIGLLVVLESLSPAERLAFVLHDMFAIPYDQIAPIMDRTAQTAKKLASQARRRVRGELPRRDGDLARQRKVVDAFLTAARGGDFDDLLRILDPDVVLRADSGKAMQVIRGATTIARKAVEFQRMATFCTSHAASVNRGAGLVNVLDGEVFSIVDFTIVDNRIVGIDIFADPARLTRLDLTAIL